jgi:hypothetical protein
MIAKLFTTNLILIAVIAAAVMFAAMVPGVAFAESSDAAACKAIGGTFSGGTCNTPAGDPTIDSAVKAVVNILSIIVGIAAVLMIIIGGFRYITSAGDANNIASAKNTVLYAIIGLVIVALAQAIVWFVLEAI